MMKYLFIKGLRYEGESEEQAQAREAAMEESNRRADEVYADEARQRKTPMPSMIEWAAKRGITVSVLLVVMFLFGGCATETPTKPKHHHHHPTPTPTPTPSPTPVATPTPSPTPTSTPTPVVTPSPTPVTTPSETPVPSVTPTPTPSPTASATPIVTVAPTPHDIAWNPPPDDPSRVAGYKLHVGSTSGVYSITFDVGLVTQISYAALNLDNAEHFFIVQAHDANYLASAPSNEVHWP